MKKKRLIPGWLLVIDLIFILCTLVTIWVTKQPSGVETGLYAIIFWLPVTIYTIGFYPIILLNIIVILIRFFQNRAIIKSNKFYTGQKKPMVVATPVNSTPVPQASSVTHTSTETGGSEGHMDLF